MVVGVGCARSAVETLGQRVRDGDPARAIALAEYARALAVRLFLPDVTGRWIGGVRDRPREVPLWAPRAQRPLRSPGLLVVSSEKTTDYLVTASGAAL